MSSGYVHWELFRRQLSYQPKPPEILRTEFQYQDTVRERSLILALDCGPQIERHDLILRFFYREKMAKGAKPYTLRSELEPSFTDTADHELLDARHEGSSSAKLEILLDRLQEIHESGHKALVFSQFTSFLKIIGKHLKDRQMRYLYLDGQTRDRSERTHRFQTDPTVPVFLISLKAGGVGLNLTAADYCFIMDPWWNPAVEAQAIDRAHRIHQKNTVFAYRMIAKDTIEEKILKLQQGKRQLAESLLQNDTSLLTGLDLRTIQSLFR